MSSERSASKSSIEKLVRFFEQNIYQLKSPNFNETQARQQLIDPFFEALGWDVRNRKMNPIYLQDVIPEGRVKTSVGKEVKEQQVLFEKNGTLGKAHREYASILDYIAEDNYKASWKEAIKKPDYRFRIKGQTKFFVEAKKPCVDLSRSAEAIFQVKRYGFSGRVPVSILTDFEEFRTFDCTHKPEFDKPKLGIVKEFDLTYKQYLDEFERLYDTFSHDAVAGGSLDTLTRKLLLKKTGDFALDKHFLEDLSKWREELARDIAKHPKNRRRLTDYTLNESVQRILDRIVFFRVCEDREIEVENTLLAILQLWRGRSGVSLYSLLNDLFKQRRPLYNGLLFAPHECEELEVGDDVLLKILEGLNYPFSPYYFNEIGVEILGSIYEKFLGKTIHLTPKTVRVEEKPEVRKAGGVYYTPQYIVNYIVDNTVGKLLYENAEGNAGKRKLKLSPKQVAKLKIIDIACGSGSFLLGAFQKLIDYHTEWYHEHPKDVESVHNVPDAYTDVNGSLALSSRKKRDILLNNIYGVDIDRQAVEVTQMSLYLKVLEGENAETLNPQMMLALKEAYLPSLSNNIKCGNSLIGTDISAQSDLFDSEATQKLNSFDWDSEFPEITRSGGFDVVIGNPPYVRQEGLGEVKTYFADHYSTFQPTADLYVNFVEKGISLLRARGLFGMIISNKWIRAAYGKPLRIYLTESAAVTKIVDLAGLPVFAEATVRAIVMICSPDRSKGGNIRYLAPLTLEEFQTIRDGGDLERYVNEKGINVSKISLSPDGWSFSSENKGLLINKMREKSIALHEYTEGQFYRGIITGFNKAFVIDESTRKQLIRSNTQCEEIIKPLIVGKDVRRYSVDFKKTYLIWTYVGVPIKKYPAVLKHLKKHQKDLEKRWDQGNYWWELRACDYYDRFEQPKLIYPDISTNCRFTLDTEGYFSSNTTYFISGDDLYLLAVLNSRLANFYFSEVCAGLEGGGVVYLRFFGQYIERFPVRKIDFTDAAEKKVHEQFLVLARKMLDLHKLLQQASFDSEKEPIQRQIAATDKKIDMLVYELYGLTEEEIKIVEGSH